MKKHHNILGHVNEFHEKKHVKNVREKSQCSIYFDEKIQCFGRKKVIKSAGKINRFGC